jgi:hypothetical protein
VVGERDAEAGRHRGAADADLAAGAQRDLEVGVVAVRAGGEQVVDAQRLRRDDLEPGARGARVVGVEQRDDRVGATVVLGVEEGVADDGRDLVAQLRRAQRVGVDEDVDAAKATA